MALFCVQPDRVAAEPKLSAGVEEELQAVKLVESTLFAANPTDEARSRQRDLYEQLEGKYPQQVAVKNAFAEFLWAIEERDQAITKWKAAHRLDPEDAKVLNHLGGAYLARGEARNAFEFFNRAVRNAPLNPLYQVNLANVAFMFRHGLSIREDAALEVARKAFAEASRLAPANADYARSYAELFYSLPNPDWSAALGAWQHFYEVTKDKDFALGNLARVHMKLGNKAAARACLDQLHSTDYQRLKERLIERIGVE